VMTNEMLKKLEEKTGVDCWEKKYPPGTTGVCDTNPPNSLGGYLCIRWETGKTTNVSFLEQIGVQFEHPYGEEHLSEECMVDFSNIAALVLRGMIVEGIDKEKAIEAIDLVSIGMKEYGFIFYKPSAGENK
jgi:hypothetical protein